MKGYSFRTVAFTGHRDYDGCADARLDVLLEGLYGEGFRTFLSGMAVGFDLAAAEAVLRLRALHGDVRLVAVVPFPGQAARFPARDRARYEAVLCAADRTEVVCPRYVPECYARRNDRLVEEASLLVAWYDGRRGGTHYTVGKARRERLATINLWDGPQPELPGLFR